MMKKFKDLQKKKGKKGFSMIELIIVIAIMAILIALIGTQLIPYLEKSRKSKDLTTLDTCLSNFNTAVTAAETSPANGTKFTSLSDMTSKNASIAAGYVEVAGEAYDSDSELKTFFKSKAAGQGANNVEFGIGDGSGTYGVAAGVAYVKVGNLIACSQYSGELVNNAIPTGSTSGSGNSGN